MKPRMGFGQVRHTRLRPTQHGFVYPTCFVMLPMRSLAQGGACALPLNRWGWMSFHDTDHGDGRSIAQGGALAWLEELLAREGIDDAKGEIWLHCFPRVLGFAFKPVSFWYCHGTDNELRAVVVEVNNTFGERHCYVLDAPRWGATHTATKVFHVSPFCRVQGSYAFRFMRTHHDARERTVVRIDHSDSEGALLHTSISGDLHPLTPAALRRAIWRYPLLTLGVVARIHWQALLLWIKRVPFFSKPTPPATPITRGDPSPASLSSPSLSPAPYTHV